MARSRRPPAWLAWVLCWVSLGMLVVSNLLRWLLRDEISTEYGGWLGSTISALGFAGIPVVGALIASRLPANPYGWLWCLAGLAYGLSELAEPLVRIVDGPVWVGRALENCCFVGLTGLLVFVFLLFPDGRLPSPRWRWLARAAVTVALLVALASPFTYEPGDPATAGPWVLPGVAGRNLVGVGLTVMFSLVLAAMFSLIVRFRGANPVQRRQLAWFLYATVVNASLLLLDAVGLLRSGPIAETLSAAGIALLPGAVGVAVLRYRLYEIDRIISRSVSYGLLTGGLVVLYLGLVAVLRPLLEPLTGSSVLAVAGSTLAVAAAFTPARRRVQAVVDRRFDRARYDAGKAVDAFSMRLRSQVDLDEVEASLRETVVATVAPTRVAVWLRAPSDRVGSEP